MLFFLISGAGPQQSVPVSGFPSFLKHYVRDQDAIVLSFFMHQQLLLLDLSLLCCASSVHFFPLPLPATETLDHLQPPTLDLVQKTLDPPTTLDSISKLRWLGDCDTRVEKT